MYFRWGRTYVYIYIYIYIYIHTHTHTHTHTYIGATRGSGDGTKDLHSLHCGPGRAPAVACVYLVPTYSRTYVYIYGYTYI